MRKLDKFQGAKYLYHYYWSQYRQHPFDWLKYASLVESRENAQFRALQIRTAAEESGLALKEAPPRFYAFKKGHYQIEVKIWRGYYFLEAYNILHGYRREISIEEYIGGWEPPPFFGWVSAWLQHYSHLF